MILYLVRHGVAEGAEGRCIGRTDAPLSEAGASSIRRLASAWAHPPDRLIASGLARAHSSAAVLADAWNLPVKTEPRLGEMDFGAWDGRTWAELEAADGARLAEWMGAWVTVPAPGGESFGDVAARVRAWADELPRGGSAAVVGHAGSIRALLCTLLELPLDAAFRLRIDHGRVSAVRLGAHGCELLFLNADHVPAD
ncbi:MAG TPA: histidine phosphatase family protein [Longimicrobium sp.]|nr:histidine phosphatase family protein [Longimicrobium sp.]